MQAHELANRLEAILTTPRPASLRLPMRTDASTCDLRRGIAFSKPDAAKVSQIAASGSAAWIIQTRDLREIIHCSGPTRVVDNPALKAELMEILGPRLESFWKTNAPGEEFVVIETLIKEATLFKPMQAVRETVTF